ncbi:MAG: hypothetical protein L3K14_03840 [Thermoplasmata archaeon]|nr:hypothetical protein [Thermoplasmata archaeon]
MGSLKGTDEATPPRRAGDPMIRALQGTSQMARRGVEPREPLPGNGE